MVRLVTRFLFALVFMAVLASGTPGRAAEGESAKKAEAPKEEPKKEAGGEGGPPAKKSDDITGGRFAGDPVYVHLPPMVLPVISDSGAEQLVTLIVDVEVKDFKVADDMHSKMPRVQDALMRSLYGGLGKGTLRNGKLVDVNKIKAKIASSLSEVVGPDGVREVLIEGVAQRML